MNKRIKEVIIRTLSGILFIALMVVAILYSPILFVTLFSLILAGSLWEFYKLRGVKDFWVRYVLLILFTLLFANFALTVFFSENWGASNNDICSIPITPIYITIGILLFVLIISILSLYLIIKLLQGKKKSMKDVVFSLFILPAFYILPFFCSYDKSEGSQFLLSLFIIIWAGDVGAYCIGSLLGREPHGHRLAPKISPNKSWEGVFGGVLFALIATLILLRLGWFNVFGSFGISDSWRVIIVSLVFAFIFYCSAIVGDLLESMIKRGAGVKDSGIIMPGHGGFLDRFDSMLVAMPTAAVFIALYYILFKLV